MPTIKKKNLKNYKAKEEIEELVDADGSPIEGSKNQTNDSEIETAPQQTTDKFAKSAVQPNRWYYGADGTPYSRGSRSGSGGLAGIYEDGEEVNEDEELAESINKDKIRKMVEDIVSRGSDSDMVRKTMSPDVNRNQIADIEELATNKPLPARYTEIFIDDMKKTNLNGDELAIVLNYILTNVNINDLSPDYKKILKNKI